MPLFPINKVAETGFVDSLFLEAIKKHVVA